MPQRSANCVGARSLEEVVTISFDLPDRDVQGDLRPWAVSLLKDQAPTEDTSVAGRLQRLCRAMSAGLQLPGAALDLRSKPDREAIVAASDEVAREGAALEFDLGEGPARDAFTDGRPVLVPDLAATQDGAWPGYAPAARAAGIGATFSFPMHVGAARFGVLTVYSSVPRRLDRIEVRKCLAIADLATEILLGSSETTTDGEIDPGLKGALGFRSEIYQAQGMLMVALEITLAESLARMRGHAFSSGRDLIDVAVDLVAGKLALTNDHR